MKHIYLFIIISQISINIFSNPIDTVELSPIEISNLNTLLIEKLKQLEYTINRIGDPSNDYYESNINQAIEMYYRYNDFYISENLFDRKNKSFITIKEYLTRIKSFDQIRISFSEYKIENIYYTNYDYYLVIMSFIRKIENLSISGEIKPGPSQMVKFGYFHVNNINAPKPNDVVLSKIYNEIKINSNFIIVNNSKPSFNNINRTDKYISTTYNSSLIINENDFKKIKIQSILIPSYDAKIKLIKDENKTLLMNYPLLKTLITYGSLFLAYNYYSKYKINKSIDVSLMNSTERVEIYNKSLQYQTISYVSIAIGTSFYINDIITLIKK